MREPKRLQTDEHRVHINFRPLFLFAIGVGSGVFIASTLTPKIVLICLLAISAAAVMSVLLKRKTTLVITLGILLGMLRLFTAAPEPMELSNDVQFVTGKVYICETNTVILTDIRIDGKPTDGRLLIKGQGIQVDVDDVVTISAPIFTTQDYENSSYSRYLLSEHITCITNSTDIQEMNVLENSLSTHGMFYRSREWLKEKIRTLYGDDAGIVCGILLGETSEMNGEISDGMRSSGIAHLFALSGLHVSILAGAADKLLEFLRCDARRRIMATLLILYCAITGFPVSLVRATLMILLKYAISYSECRYDSLSSCATAATLILLVNPYQLYSAGFLLSFGAVFGIAMLEKTIREMLSHKISRSLRSAISVSASASLATAPLIAVYFGSVALYSIPVNIVAVPVASLAVITAFVSLAVGIVCGFAAVPFVFVTKILLDIVVQLALAVSELKLSLLHLGNVPILSCLLCFMALYASSQFVIARTKYKLYASTALVSLAILLYACL